MKYNDFYNKGYQIIEGMIDISSIENYKEKLNEILKLQENEFSKQELELIGEESTIRSPFLSHQVFIELFSNNRTKKIIKDLLGDYAILSLQNGIIVEPNKQHHQSFYHRDIIHQDFVSSKPLSINLYYCLSDYTEKNGSTIFIPRSHKFDKFPDVYEEECVSAKAGDMILFDSMVYHKAGCNKSSLTRYGINHMITLPFIKQQIRYPSVVKEPNDPYLKRLFGFESLEHLSVKEFRNYRSKRRNGK